MDDNSRPAFPHSASDGYIEFGMSLRDYFAGQALIGLLMHDDVYLESAAESAYSAADIMLEIRER